jgi:hypothetical protein
MENYPYQRFHPRDSKFWIRCSSAVKMAYALDEYYQQQGRNLSVEQFVRENI